MLQKMTQNFFSFFVVLQSLYCVVPIWPQCAWLAFGRRKTKPEKSKLETKFFVSCCCNFLTTTTKKKKLAFNVLMWEHIFKEIQCESCVFIAIKTFFPSSQSMVGWNFITIANREHIEGEQKHKVFQRLHIIAAKTEPPEWSSGYATVIRRTIWYSIWCSILRWCDY